MDRKPPIDPNGDTSPSACLQSTLTCPICGWTGVENMPVDTCQFFYECSGCGGVLRPKVGDCCVFCSYGTTPCPSQQHST